MKLQQPFKKCHGHASACCTYSNGNLMPYFLTSPLPHTIIYLYRPKRIKPFINTLIHCNMIMLTFFRKFQLISTVFKKFLTVFQRSAVSKVLEIYYRWRTSPRPAVTIPLYKYQLNTTHKLIEQGLIA